MVVDCGGGTVDITVHQLSQLDGKLKELATSVGSAHGSIGGFHIIMFYGDSFSNYFYLYRCD